MLEGGLPGVVGRAEIWGTQEQLTLENTRQGDSGAEQCISLEQGSSHWAGLQVENGQITAGPYLGRRRNSKLGRRLRK